MTFFIVKNGKPPMIFSISNSFNEAQDKLVEVTTDFIRDEEGNKKAKNAFVVDENELKLAKYEDGYYLIKTNNGYGISVMQKKTSIGYLYSASAINEVACYYICEFRNTKEKLELPMKESKNFVGIMNENLLTELKEKLKSRRSSV